MEKLGIGLKLQQEKDHELLEAKTDARTQTIIIQDQKQELNHRQQKFEKAVEQIGELKAKIFEKNKN